MNRTLLLLCVVLVSLWSAGVRHEVPDTEQPAASAPADEQALPAAVNKADKLWEITLGTQQYGIPKIYAGRIFLAINDLGLKHHAAKRTGGGLLMCLDQKTRELLWQLPIPRFPKELHRPHFFDQWRCGICSCPVVDGDRLYIVSNRGEVLCVDIQGLSDGNNGSFTEELRYIGVPEESKVQLDPTDGDILWRHDMLCEPAVYPHDVCGSTVLINGDLLYACTSNGIDENHEKATNPLAPSLIALDKRTGRLVAKDDERIGTRLFHGQWSSPTAGLADGRTLIFFGGGDGVLYAFEALDPSSQEGSVRILKKVWSHDCNPREYRFKDGQPLRYCGFLNRYRGGPSDIIATPVFHDGRIYVAIGQSPIHGPGAGMLSCLDAATGRQVWASTLADRTLCTVAIADGLLYIADYSGNIHCFDAQTGRRHWSHQLGSGVWCASPIVYASKVYISTEDRDFWTFAAATEKHILGKNKVDSMAITPLAADGVLYIPTQRRLCAYRTTPTAGAAN